VLFIALSRVFHSRDARTLEVLAVVVPVAGMALEVAANGFATIPLVVFGLYLVGLVVYGVLAGRRVPFIGALAVFGGGLAWKVVAINFWLAPLAVGLLAIAAVLLMEINPAAVEQRLSAWRLQWQQWE